MKEYKITVFGNPTCLVNRRTYPLIKKLADGKIKFTGSCVWNCNKTKASTFTKEEAEEMVEKLNTLSNMAEHWRKERFDFTIEEW